jgi:hypothetical protein
LVVDPRYSTLASIVISNRLLKPHKAQHLPGRTPDIYILPTVPKGWRLLDDRDIAVLPGQPPSGGAACDTGSCDEYAA